MKKNKLLGILSAGLFLLLLSSCKNDDWSFPDYGTTTVYFPYQYPVRTIELGDDILYDNSLDNEHKCKIMATMGGVYSNKEDRILHVAVDESLCDSLLFSAGDTVKAMPKSYYSLPSDMTITISSGSLSGGIEVTLNDAFFNDPKSIKNTYVIPLKITSVENADSILQGDAAVSNPNRNVSTDWNTVPKNYVLYCIKYINPLTCSWLRRGVDVCTSPSSADTTITRHAAYVEKDEVCTRSSVTSQSMTETLFSLNTYLHQTSMPFEMLLTCDASDSINSVTVSNPANVNYTITGTGSYVKKGDKDSWGGEDRNALFLKYQVTFPSATYQITDTLAMRTRDVVFERFDTETGFSTY
jgi:hypothetical protein